MSYDCIKTTTASTGSTNFTVSPLTLPDFRPFSDLTPGEVRSIRISDGTGNWMLVSATITGNTSFAVDEVITGSLGASPVNFGVGTKTVEVVLSSVEIEELRALAQQAGQPGPQGEPGADGAPGSPGASAYQIAVSNGFVGTQAAWLLSLKGADGADGTDGEQGIQGIQGLKGDKGDKGDPGTPGAGAGAATQDVAFTQVLPFNFAGATRVAPQTVSAKYTFTASANPILFSQVYNRLTANGNASHIPEFPGQVEIGGTGWRNEAGIVNHIWHAFNGTDYTYTISQAVGAVPADIQAPTQQTAAVANATPSTVTITFNEALAAGFVPAASAFTVGGHTVLSVALSGSAANLSVSPAFVNGEAARAASYTQPATDGLRDAAGNLVSSFTGLTITNNVAPVDSTAPAFSSAQVANAAPSVVQVTMTETLAASVPPTSAFALSQGKTVSSVSINGAVVSVTANSPFVNGDVIQITYTQPGANPRLQDAAGNATGSFGPSSVTNNVAAAGDTLAPVLSSPSATKTGSTTATGQVSTTNDANGTLYYRATANASESVATVKAGANQPVTATGVQNVSFTGLPAASTLYPHYVHTDAAGNDSNVASGASFTTDAAAGGGTPEFAQLTGITKAGTDPNTTYTGNTVASPYSNQTGLSTTGRPASTDASMQLTLNTAASDGFIFGVTTSSTPVAFASLPYALYCNKNNNTWKKITNGTPANADTTTAVANADKGRLRFVGTTLIGEVTKDNGATWSTIATWTSVPASAYKFELILNGVTQVGSPVGANLA